MLRADPARRYTIDGAAFTLEEIIHRYLSLVKYAAGRIYVNLPSSVDINDLISDGVFGLIDAIEKYDSARAVKFETYAMTRINGAIFDALRTLDWVPRTVRQQARQVERAHDRLEVELGRAPNDVELARRLDLSVRELDRLMQAGSRNERRFARGTAAELRRPRTLSSRHDRGRGERCNHGG